MDKDTSIILLLIVTGLCIWLYTKLKKEKIINDNLSKERDHLAGANSRLIADNALLEAEHLKFQLQPHTLNNILANLKLISSKLNKGLDALSETLDYILYKGNTHLVSIEEELNFLKKYLDLNDLFITEIDSIKINLSNVNNNSKYYKTKCLPHLISAYFLENAFKHGDISHPNFLNLEIKLSDTSFEMIVINKIRKKAIETNGGIGLSNMKKRLELLQSGKFEINTNHNDQEYVASLIIRFQ